MVNREFLEPITSDNIGELNPGDWIWDDWDIFRLGRKEAIGFRQIEVMNLRDFEVWHNNPFLLSSIDNTEPSWAYFAEGRFFKFKEKKDE